MLVFMRFKGDGRDQAAATAITARRAEGYRLVSISECDGVVCHTLLVTMEKPELVMMGGD